MLAAEYNLSHTAGRAVQRVECTTRESDLHEYLEKHFSLSAREAAIRLRRLYSIEIEVTKTCNLECPYCYSESSRRTQESFPPDILRRVLREGYEYGLRSVSWFGGEPLLYSELFDVLKYAMDLGYHESIIYTNGISLTPEVTHRLNGLVNEVVPLVVGIHAVGNGFTV